MARRGRRWRLTKTALNRLTKHLDGIKAIVERAADRADQMDGFVGDASSDQDADLAAEYEKASTAFRDVATGVIDRVDKLAQECMAMSDGAEDAARRAYELKERARKRRLMRMSR